MEANVEEPLATDEIAALVGLSRRQLERLFRQYLGSVPSKYYLALRLMKARMQLRRTSKSVVQVSLACGFASAAHFSNAYRERFGVTPREDRRDWMAKQQAGGAQQHAAEPPVEARTKPADAVPHPIERHERRNDCSNKPGTEPGNNSHSERR
jgi:AraC-like DNA-binding protein